MRAAMRLAAITSDSRSRPKNSNASRSESSNGARPLYGEGGAVTKTLIGRPVAYERWKGFPPRERAEGERRSRHGLGRSKARIAGERLDVAFERQVMHVDVAAPPELALQRLCLRLHRPGAIAERLVAPEAVEDDPQVPVAHRVSEEEEVAAPQLGCECDGHRTRDVAPGEVVDVVILGDDEALPLALRAAIDLAVELENHGALLERQLGRVSIREVDQPACAVWADVTELAAIRTRGNVGDDVERLAGLEEGGFEPEVVARRHEQL